MFHPGVDATVHDASHGSDVTTMNTPDVGASVDTGGPTMDASKPDQGVPPGMDAMTPHDAGHDAGTSHDAGHHDAGTDAGTTHDSGAAHDAARMCPGYSAPDQTDLCTACITQMQTCQANGCFGGYYCHTSTLGCTKPINVKCDGGV